MTGRKSLGEKKQSSPAVEQLWSSDSVSGSDKTEFTLKSALRRNNAESRVRVQVFYRACRGDYIFILISALSFGLIQKVRKKFHTH